MTRAATELRTQRTLLRPFSLADVPEAFAVFGDPVVMRYAAGAPDRDTAATRARLERYIAHQEHHGFSKWSVRDAQTGAYLGDAGVLHLPETGELELGYRLARTHWGRGLATEVASAWLGHAREVLRLQGLIAFADRRNTASIRVLHKIGMQFARFDRLCDMDCVVHAAAPAHGHVR
ncbi:GNAT family N-acetyltransferase [Nannocystis punicea]|uniref:GNAT family N-acetyltransferase n=1 Tax=Nannocystis punicea TaxID=2995304 RepID=A0ABY7HD84_9BACT|nr:GNAT family N-acetyltransferase [Nannocystis poenicansa]WAS96954.1 GNAT family N-acetyltransferase [Nannocystis poenicansa]